MAHEGTFRALRGAFGNALVWGASWSVMWVGAVAVYTTLGAVGIGPGLSPLDALGAAGRFGVMFGIIGSVAGMAFSGLMRLFYRGRRLSELSAVRFGITGGIMAGIFVPAYLQTMNLISGDGLVPMHLVLDDAPIAALFGFVAAAVSLKLAQHADVRGLGSGGGARVGGSLGPSAGHQLPGSPVARREVAVPEHRGQRAEKR